MACDLCIEKYWPGANLNLTLPVMFLKIKHDRYRIEVNVSSSSLK